MDSIISFIKHNVTIESACLLLGIEGSLDENIRCPNKEGHKHGDRNPSMHIYKKTNSFHCFGCDIDGDVLDLVCLVKDIDVSDAIRFLKR